MRASEPNHHFKNSSWTLKCCLSFQHRTGLQGKHLQDSGLRTGVREAAESLPSARPVAHLGGHGDPGGRRQWHPTPVLLPGKSHGWRSLVGCSPWGRQELDTTERLHFHFSLSCIAEGNGNPLQCSCLENPRAGGAWWAAVYGVAQSRTRLKRLSSSSRGARMAHRR